MRHQVGLFERLRMRPPYVQRGLARPFHFRRDGKAVNSWGMHKFISTEEWEVEEEEEVKVEDMDRMEFVCACEDDGACELKHERPAETLRERIALFCRFLRGEASS
jgi:hypothetical protein